ncbi:HAD-IA family hydrolase [Methyloceanibacter sp.]|uniref:HAD-IA family hydrolase n=1 Tax=Methyloceanibacter sp. TaxID=1965321 RepID=UPI002BFDC892|nr:HAD-IA family hydrolase [Methyloceanibacter sp.]HML91811.1 HAD-IA family hydrolase [Methyloceanibacter sp.]
MFKKVTFVFDLDGTLVDTAPDLTNALNHALKLHGHPPVEAERVREAVGRGAPAMIFEALGTGIGTDGILADFLVHYEANIAAESRPYPGAVAALEGLTAAGAKLAVCTNKRERLARLLLDTLGIGHHFAAIAGRDTFDVSKPHPGHLLGTIAASGGTAARAVMVGDGAVDIQAAAAAGVPSVLVSFGYCPPPPEGPRPGAVIDRFETLQTAAGLLLKRLTDRDPSPS